MVGNAEAALELAQLLGEEIARSGDQPVEVAQAQQLVRRDVPIMIALSLFDATKDFFHRWVSTTISYAFYPIVIAAIAYQYFDPLRQQAALDWLARALRQH